MWVSVRENAPELGPEIHAILGLRAASCRCPHLEIRNPQSAICNSSPDISTPTLEIHCQIKEFCHPAPE